MSGGRSRKRKAHVIVLGNEKGGSGKTTTSMHLVVALMRAGFTVASIDLDGRQRTLSRYLENRRDWIRDRGHSLPLPDHHVLTPSTRDSTAAAEEEDRETLEGLVRNLMAANDFVVIDCPGSDAALSRFAHRLADTLITPLNDSLLDLDVVVHVERETHTFRGAGVYSEMVMAQRQEKSRSDRPGMDWILLRNRLASLESRNKKQMNGLLDNLSRTVGCRVALGISERVIFRQLFLSGLTVLDLREKEMAFEMSLSHVAARQEMRQLLESLWLPSLTRRLDLI